MSAVATNLYNRIVEIVAHHAGDSNARIKMLRNAFGNIPLTEQIDTQIRPLPYAMNVTRQALVYGRIDSGEHALKKLLKVIEDDVSEEDKADISAIIHQLKNDTLEELANLDGVAIHHAFISYSRANSDFVQRITKDLRDRGVAIWVDMIGLTPGTPDWEQALRDAIQGGHSLVLIASPESRRSPYVRDEVAIAKAQKKHIFPVWAKGDEWIDSIPMGFGQVQYVDMRGKAYDEGLAIVARHLQSRQPLEIELTDINPCTDDAPRRNPFVGLKAYRNKDRNYFFGRSELVKTLITRVKELDTGMRFIQLIGPSGSGKSSVMQAGLLPALQSGEYIDGSDQWLFLNPIAPGLHPIENLAIALWQYLSDRTLEVIKETLTGMDNRGLHQLSAMLLDDPDKGMVIYIDQFEELFTLTQNQEEVIQFIDLLLTASEEPRGQVIVMTSIRADYYHKLLEHPRLSHLVADHSVNIEPMTIADFVNVINGPVQLPDICLEYDDSLVTKMVYDVRNQSGALPLLQFTLDQLFRQREERLLTNRAYEAMGGVTGALIQHAESVYNTLPDDYHRKLTQNLFMRLVHVSGSLEQATRRPIRRSVMTMDDDRATTAFRTIIENFVNARLLTADEDFIYLSHDSLTRHWTRLQEWLEQSQALIRHLEKLRNDVDAWIADKRSYDYDGLYTGTVLERIEDIAKMTLLTTDEMNFISKSRKRFDEIQASELRREEDLRSAKESAKQALITAEEAEHEAKSNRNRAITILLVGILITMLVSWFGWHSLRDNSNAQTFTEAISMGVGINPYDESVPAKEILAIATAQAQTVSQANTEIALFDGVEMVFVPGGSFWSGAVEDIEDPTHTLSWQPVDSFWIDRYEVTNEQFDTFIGDHQVDFMNYQQEALSDNLYPIMEERNPEGNPMDEARIRLNACDYTISEGDDMPKTCITYEGASHYCLEYREGMLPDFLQWEYASRGSYSLRYPWGNEYIEGIAVVEDFSPQPVGSHPENASWIGAMDMAGNMAEWVIPQDGENNEIRGGAFDDSPDALQSASYTSLPRHVFYPTISFRCIRLADE